MSRVFTLIIQIVSVVVNVLPTNILTQRVEFHTVETVNRPDNSPKTHTHTHILLVSSLAFDWTHNYEALSLKAYTL